MRPWALPRPLMLAFFPPVAFLTIALFVARKMPKLGVDNPNGAFVCNHKKCKKLDLIEATVHHTVLEPDSSSPMEDAMQALPITFLPSACVRGGPRLHQKARHVFGCTLFSQQSLTTAFCHSWGWAIHIPASNGRGACRRHQQRVTSASTTECETPPSCQLPYESRSPN